jgi:hypothetical protein
LVLNQIIKIQKMIGETLEEYTLLKLIGEGGMAKVY